jgi:glycosyltransferase 2 family protein
VNRHLLTVAATLGGFALFAVAVRATGLANITDGVGRVGWGLLPILGLAGVRFALRAECWRLCMPAASRLSFRRGFTAFLAGDAIGNLTPLGLAASEPAKVVLARPELETREAVSSLAVDNLAYTASVATVVAVATALLVWSARLSFAWREAAIGALVAGAVAVVVGFRLLRGTWRPDRGARPAWREKLAAWRETILQSSALRASQLWRVYGIHLVFHVLAVVEVFLTLRWLGDANPTVTDAVIFEGLNRVMTAVFKFVPFRVGVDEAASGGLSTLLGIPPVVGVTMAVVRKVRNLFWTAVGLTLIGVHRARAVQATDPRESAPGHRS